MCHKLTTEAYKEIGTIDPEAPVILTTAKKSKLDECARTMSALELRRPLPEGVMKIVAQAKS